jgi:small nuclear ribonucleoprotein (snRNP)-like protein
MRKITSSSLVLLLLFSIAQVASGKPQGDWATLKSFVGQPVAIKAEDGSTTFGILSFVDDSLIKIQLAWEDQLTSQEISFKRGEVTKVWHAKFRFGETHIKRGALIGLAVGMGVGYAVAYATRKQGPPHGAALFPLGGVSIGALVGSSRSKDHKKQKLIYSV